MQKMEPQKSTNQADTVATKIASFSGAELEFYTECAEMAGEDLEQWVAHMDEV